MSILLYGKNADRTHENQMLQDFIQTLKADWENADKDIILIPNSMWNGAEIDLVCILPSALLLIDFKNYKGHLTAAENGPWLMDGVEVKGGSRENPYHQLLANKRAVMDWLSSNSFLKGRNVTHVSAAVVFSGPITGQPVLSPRVKPWFYVTDIANCADFIAGHASPELQIYPQDRQSILTTLGVQQITYRGTKVRPPVPPTTTTDIEKLEEPNPTQTDQAATVVGNTPEQEKPITKPVKSSMSGMFKSAMAVGGVFLVMAVVSQIYPTVGQSSPVTVEEPRQQSYTVEPKQNIQPVFNTQQQQPTTSVALAQNTNRVAAVNQIDARSAASYIGQNVTACGAVAQYTRFKKGVYLNLDKPYPKQSLTVVIWDDMLTAVESKFGKLDSLMGVELCANGQVNEYKRQPRIEISDISALHTLRLKTNNTQPMPTNTNTNTKATQNETSAERIEAYRAPFHVGQQVMACGVLAGTSKFAKGMYLSLDKKYPNQTLTLVVWNESIAPLEAKFGSFNSKIGHTFCALGTIEKYKKHLQIQIENPQFLRLMSN